MSASANLQKAFCEALASGKELRINLEGAAELGITTLQLLWAAGQEAAAAGVGLVVAGRLPEAVTGAVREAGLAKFPIPVEVREK